jgi:glycosyltransferase involved in cell wall biosynthesis
MRIIISCNEYLPSLSGVPVAVSNLAAMLIKAGHQVLIVTSKHDPALRKEETIQNIDVYRFGWSPKPVLTLPARFIDTLLKLLKIYRTFCPDIIYVHFLSTNALYFLILHWYLNFPFVISARGNDIDGLPHEKLFHRRMLESLFRRADVVGFCSKALKDRAGIYLSSANKAGVILGDGVNVTRIVQAEPFLTDTKYVFAVGRLVKKKGFDLLVQAFAKVLTDYPDLQLWIAGDGPERDSLDELINSLNVFSQIKLLGSINQEDIARYHKASLFFVLSSREEPFGIVNLEAMAASKAVVATNVGGVPGVVCQGETGILVEPTVDGLFSGMLEMLSDPKRMKHMGETGYKVAQQQFNWEEVVKSYILVFENAIGSHAN